MESHRLLLRGWMVCLVWVLLLVTGTEAEWLVTRDANQVEIDGPWRVDGELVTFTLPNGTLGSLPLAFVDLELSRLATEKAAAHPEATEIAMPREARFVITDTDVGHPTAPASDNGAGQREAIGPSAAPPRLQVTSWNEQVDVSTASVIISGNLENQTENPATKIEVEVRLLADDGALLETSRAHLDRGFLNPGGNVGFQATFANTLSYDSVDFNISSRGFLSSPSADQSGIADDSAREATAPPSGQN